MDFRRNRFVTALIILVVWIVLLQFGQKIFTPNAGSLNDLVSSQINITFVIVAALLLALVFYFGWQREAGLKPAESPRSWLLLWLPALFVLAYVGFGALIGLPPSSVVLFVLINTLLVGVEEELMFRGILFQGLLTRLNIWPAILLAAVLFGAVHALNGFLTGDFTAALLQALQATMSGIWFMAIRLRARSIYPAMLIHGLWDFGAFIFGLAAAGSSQAAAPSGAATPFAAQFGLAVLLPLPLLLYGLWLLRGIGKQTKEQVLA